MLESSYSYFIKKLWLTIFQTIIIVERAQVILIENLCFSFIFLIYCSLPLVESISPKSFLIFFYYFLKHTVYFLIILPYFVIFIFGHFPSSVDTKFHFQILLANLIGFIFYLFELNYHFQKFWGYLLFFLVLKLSFLFCLDYL